MAQNAQLSTIATFVLVVFLALIMGFIGIFTYTCTRASKRNPSNTIYSSWTQSKNSGPGLPTSTSTSSSSGTSRHSPSPPPPPPSPPSPIREVRPLVGFKNVWNRKSLVKSASMLTIKISPSKPAIFGNDKDEEGSSTMMQVVLTPPTPAKVAPSREYDGSTATVRQQVQMSMGSPSGPGDSTSTSSLESIRSVAVTSPSPSTSNTAVMFAG